ncbi:MAG TPA: hypothetical protein VFJ12_03360 [Segeticoccus sp.]|nr:hypothetical protein [Segeticoccus sp.]
MRAATRTTAVPIGLVATLLVLVGSPALAGPHTPRDPRPFQPADTTAYAVSTGAEPLHGLLLWLAGLAVFLVVGGGYRWYQRTRS